MGRRGHVLAACCGVCLLLAPTVRAGEVTTVATAEQQLVAEINRARAAHGVPPLRVDPRLRNAARAHSRDMLAHGYLGHGNFGRRLQSYGVRRRVIAENLAWAAGDRVDARLIVTQWLASEGHRTNVLSRQLRRIGVGAAVGHYGGNSAYFVTADFST